MKARQLSCETFSRSMDAAMEKNWLKRVFDTLTDIELNDDLKLRVATKLIEKSATTWWDNLKLRAIHRLLGVCSFESSMNSFLLDSIGTKRDRNSFG